VQNLGDQLDKPSFRQSVAVPDLWQQQAVSALREGKVNPDDPAVTLALLRADAVVGLTGFFDKPRKRLVSVGIQCALCHSTVDDSLAPGVGHRLDGWANRDLNVGAIISLAPRLQPVADLLGTSVETLRDVLGKWGPGRPPAALPFLPARRHLLSTQGETTWQTERSTRRRAQ
jgi:hypothetical protein